MFPINLIFRDIFLNSSGNALRVNSKAVIGKKYFIEDQHGYCTSGSLDNEALTNTTKGE